MATPTCRQCGAQVQDTDDFCGNCGNYLGWGANPERGEETVADPDAPKVPSEAEAAPVVVEPEQLGPVLPGRPRARRPLPSASAQAAVTGPPCPVCGTPNPPGRRFCRRCATSLDPAEPVPVTARRRRWRWRGDRSRWLRRLAALLAVAVLVVAGFLLYPRATALWEDLRDRLSTPAPISPASTTASASVPGHPANAAVDGLTNRYWGAPAVGDSIEFTFPEPFRLLSVVVHAGGSTDEDAFVTQARPSTLDMEVISEDGTTQTVRVNLADEPGPQTTNTGIGDVVRVRLVVRGAVGSSPGKHIAFGEVEFFRRP